MRNIICVRVLIYMFVCVHTCAPVHTYTVESEMHGSSTSVPTECPSPVWPLPHTHSCVCTRTVATAVSSCKEEQPGKWLQSHWAG